MIMSHQGRLGSIMPFRYQDLDSLHNYHRISRIKRGNGIILYGKNNFEVSKYLSKEVQICENNFWIKIIT